MWHTLYYIFWRFLFYFSDTIPKDWRQNLCTETRTVFAAHPEDCSKFFICHAHRAFPVNCPAGTLYDKNLKICNHAYAVDCIKEPLKTSEKTDPCLKKGFGINPRDAVIGLDPKCEENFQIISETDLTEDFDYIFDGPAPLPPCELDIRSSFESDNCDPNLPTSSAGTAFNPRTSDLGGWSFDCYIAQRTDTWIKRRKKSILNTLVLDNFSYSQNFCSIFWI